MIPDKRNGIFVKPVFFASGFFWCIHRLSGNGQPFFFPGNFFLNFRWISGKNSLSGRLNTGAKQRSLTVEGKQ
ncbi:hypothetical protein B5E53_05075 [Eubacterium sp. An11]|nr:hypothetical protein B5E53_05075 [Eubacterium sp. An11]